MGIAIPEMGPLKGPRAAMVAVVRIHAPLPLGLALQTPTLTKGPVRRRVVAPSLAAPSEPQIKGAEGDTPARSCLRCAVSALAPSQSCRRLYEGTRSVRESSCRGRLRVVDARPLLRPLAMNTPVAFDKGGITTRARAVGRVVRGANKGASKRRPLAT